MSESHRVNRKAEDKDIIRLNSLGLSLKTIGKTLDCHPTTVKVRLTSLGIPAADTRRAFMEDIYNDLSPPAKAWLTTKLQGTVNIKDIVAQLINCAHVQEKTQETQI